MRKFYINNLVQLVITISFTLSPNLQAAPPSHGASLKNDCVTIISDLQRLACFDKKYATPSYFSPKDNTGAGQGVMPEFIRLAYQREENRLTHELGFVEDISGPIENKTIRISSLSRGNYEYQPLLLISCVDNITRMQIGLTQPIDAHTFPVSVTKENHVISSYKWKSSNSGYVIDVGRGLYSIKIIKGLFKQNYIDVDLQEIGIGEVRFDITGLSERINHLRNACHW